MSYYYGNDYNPAANLSLWDIIEALQNQASAADAGEDEPQTQPQARRASSQARPAPQPQQPQGPSRYNPQRRAPPPFERFFAREAPFAPTPAASAPAPKPEPVPARAPAPAPAPAAPASAKASFSPLILKPVSRTDVFLPPIDVYDTPEAYRLYASVPGARKASVEVHFNPDTHELTVEGEVPTPAGIDTENARVQQLLSERETGAFARTLHLPSEPKIDDEKISAKFNAGILEITVPKKVGAKTTRRKITIEDVDDEELLAEAQEPIE